jgi:hypothetical protein
MRPSKPWAAARGTTSAGSRGARPRVRVKTNAPVLNLSFCIMDSLMMGKMKLAGYPTGFNILIPTQQQICASLSKHGLLPGLEPG